MKELYFTNGDALRAAREFAAENGGQFIVNASFDSHSNDIEESDNFREIVGLWSGEASCYRVESGAGQILGYFGYWENGSSERLIYSKFGRFSVYICEDAYYINMSAGWAIYLIDDFTLAEALINQHYLDNPNCEEEPEYKDVCKYYKELAKTIQLTK